MIKTRKGNRREMSKKEGMGKQMEEVNGREG